MILTVEPCRKSFGVKKKPQISPPTRQIAAMVQTQGRIGRRDGHELARVRVFPERCHGAFLGGDVCALNGTNSRRLTRSRSFFADGAWEVLGFAYFSKDEGRGSAQVDPERGGGGEGEDGQRAERDPGHEHQRRGRVLPAAPRMTASAPKMSVGT
jgi:hypothetical protein